jgi:hypothetical protein
MADYTIINEGDLKEYQAKIENWWKSLKI